MDLHLPSIYSSESLASFSFVKVRNPLETSKDQDPIIQCHVLVTKNAKIISIVDEIVETLADSPCQDVSKVLVHHEFYPTSRYVIILSTSGSAWMLSENLQNIIGTWTDIKDILSTNNDEDDIPELILVKLSGIELKIDPLSVGNEIIEGDDSLNEDEDLRSSAKDDAIKALNYRSASLLQHSCSIRDERFSKEAFVLQSTKEMSRDLFNHNTKTDTKKESTSNVDKSSHHVSIANIRQRIANSKWVICITVSNVSKRVSIVDPKLYLSFPPEVPPIQYKVKIFKTINRRQKNRAESNEKLQKVIDSGIFIEELTNHKIGPGKRAFILAAMDLPLCSLSSVTVKGLLAYGNPQELYQVALLPITLSMKDLNSLIAFPMKDTEGRGLSSDIVCLFATLEKYSFNVHSEVSSISDFTKILISSGMIQVPYLERCFLFDSSGPLHNSIIDIRIKSNNDMSISFYARDHQQSILLLHWFSNLLPADVICTPDSKSKDLNVSKTWMNTLSSGADLVYEAILNNTPEQDEAVGKKRKKIQLQGNLDENEQRLYTCKDYNTWREELHNIQAKMEILRIQNEERD